MTAISPVRLPALPQELIDVIIENLAGDSTNLQACSLVSSSFREPAQRRLFRAIYIHLDETLDASLIHATQITSSPRLASFVESLKIHFHFRSCLFKTRVSWDGPPLILPRLRHLELNVIDSGFGMYFKLLPHTVQDNLLRLMDSPQLEHLVVRAIKFPLRILHSLDQIKHLELFPPFACMLKRDPLPLPYHALTPNSSGPGCLDTLSLIDGMRDTAAFDEILAAFEAPTSTVSLDRLRGLAGLIEGTESIRGLQRMLDLAGGTLEALSITFFPFDADFASAEQLNLACLSKLRWLHINIATGTTEEACPAIARILSSVTQDSGVVDVVVKAHLPGGCSAAARWGCVDEVLADKSRFPVLRACVVDLPAQSGSPEIAQFLPKLAAKGCLEKSCNKGIGMVNT
ncbi:hypothetical protein DXG03_008188 [Asterophora parasitica]|uniref:F-box domain-containing protein n=1 Tax=Asterophora parasitica TaxID=117018 RepID=A0A9P7KCU3_9AGAR|nr:hypothetical protein DXG03_008188 [Asterophora parasitica]